MRKKLIGSAFLAAGIVMMILPVFKVYYFDQLQDRLIEQHDVQIISVEVLKERIDVGDNTLTIVDVRSTAEYENSHIPLSVHIPKSELEQDSYRLDAGDDFVFFCGAGTCGESFAAAKKMQDLGFESLFILDGGYPAWENAGYPTESGACPFHGGVGEGDFWKDCMDIGLVVVAGLTDGINPCAIGMMLFLLGYLVVFAEAHEKVLPIGIVYVATVFATYFIVGMLLYGTVNAFISNSVYIRVSEILKVIIVEILIVAGLVNIKDYLYPKEGGGFTLGIPDSFQPKLKEIATKATLPGTVLLGILVTLFETPCSLPIYVGTLEVLDRRLDLGWEVFALIGIYNVLFVFPLLVILLLIVRGTSLMNLKEWEHRNRSKMKLSMGIGIIMISIIILFI